MGRQGPGTVSGGGNIGPGGGTVSHASIDNAAGVQQPSQREYNQDILRRTRQADYVGELPGWVRYAYNRNGAQSLNDPNRIDLYRNKLREMLTRFNSPNIDVPGTGLGG